MPVLDLVMTSSAHDAEERIDTGAVFLTSSDLELGNDAAQQYVGMKWPNVTVPQGAAIAAAYILFTATEVRTGAVTYTIRGEDADTAADFVGTTNNISSRTFTSASVSYAAEDWDVVNGVYQSADISPIIQEIVNRPGWASGNALVIIVDPHAVRRTAYSYNGDPAKAPILHIEYSTTPPAAPTGLTAQAVSKTQIDLAWTDNATDESGYEVERSLTGTGGWTLIHTTAANATTHSDTGLTAATTYYYRVRATNAVDDSDYSNVASARTRQGGTVVQVGHSITRAAKAQAAAAAAEPVNLIANPTFDDGLSGWTATGGTITTETDAGRPDDAAKIVVSVQGNAGISSNFWAARPDRRYEFSAEMKMENVVPGTAEAWHRMRVTVDVWDDSGKIRHYDRAVAGGSFDWKTVRGGVIPPAGTTRMFITFQLSQCTGTIWVDNVEVKETQLPPSPSVKESIYNPVLIPYPWQIQNNIGLKATKGSVFSGGQSNATIAAKFAEKWPALTWADLGDEGYFVATEADGSVYLGSDTAVGLYYAEQTLAQLEDGAGNVYLLDIADRPVLPWRGIIVGVQNYSQRATLIPYLGSLKLNAAWFQGSFLNSKFFTSWRTPLTSTEATSLAGAASLCDANHVTGWIALAPRGTDASSATTYSDPAEVQAAVDKLVEAYDAGFRHFALVYDDLQNTDQDELNATDAGVYANIGEAHYDFTLNVYNDLLTARPGTEGFAFLPLWYNNTTAMGGLEDTYLDELTALPAALEAVTVSPYKDGAAHMATKLGRLNAIWDNFWASYYNANNPAPTYVVPLNGEEDYDDTLIAGYMVLPPPPPNDSDAGIELRTTADYTWDPSRYDRDDAVARAVAAYLGTDDVPWIEVD